MRALLVACLLFLGILFATPGAIAECTPDTPAGFACVLHTYYATGDCATSGYEGNHVVHFQSGMTSAGVYQQCQSRFQNGTAGQENTLWVSAGRFDLDNDASSNNYLFVGFSDSTNGNCSITIRTPESGPPAPAVDRYVPCPVDAPILLPLLP